MGIEPQNVTEAPGRFFNGYRECVSYRYKITGEDFEFDHEEKGGRRLEVGSIIKRSQGPDEYKVTKITKEARSMFGFAPPMLSSRGSAEAERFFRAQP